MNKKSLTLIEEALAGRPVVLRRDVKARSKYAAELVYFVLVFGIGIALLAWRVMLNPNDAHQMPWDILLASLFLAWGGFVGWRSHWLMRCSSSALVISELGVELSSPRRVIKWSELKAIYALPFVVVFRGATGELLAVGFYTSAFECVYKLFLLVVAPGGSSSTDRLAGNEIRTLIDELHRRSSEHLADDSIN